LDTIDPIDLDNPYAFDSDDFETSSAGKVNYDFSFFFLELFEI